MAPGRNTKANALNKKRKAGHLAPLPPPPPPPTVSSSKSTPTKSISTPSTSSSTPSSSQIASTSTSSSRSRGARISTRGAFNTVQRQITKRACNAVFDTRLGPIWRDSGRKFKGYSAVCPIGDKTHTRSKVRYFYDAKMEILNPKRFGEPYMQCFGPTTQGDLLCFAYIHDDKLPMTREELMRDTEVAGALKDRDVLMARKGLVAEASEVADVEMGGDWEQDFESEDEIGPIVSTSGPRGATVNLLDQIIDEVYATPLRVPSNVSKREDAELPDSSPLSSLPDSSSSSDAPLSSPTQKGKERADPRPFLVVPSQPAAASSPVKEAPSPVQEALPTVPAPILDALPESIYVPDSEEEKERLREGEEEAQFILSNGVPMDDRSLLTKPIVTVICFSKQHRAPKTFFSYLMSRAGRERPEFSFRSNKQSFAAAGIKPDTSCFIHLAGLESAEHVPWPYHENLAIPSWFPIHQVPLLVYQEGFDMSMWLDPHRDTFMYQSFMIR